LAAEDVTDRLTLLMERISEEYTSGEGARQAAEAREAFLQATGRVHEGDRGFDQRMAQFMEWFLLDRPLSGVDGPTPGEAFASANRDRLTAEEKGALRALCTSHRSLFCFAGPGGLGEILVDDLLFGMRWVVSSPGLPGVSVGDVFEGRVVSVSGEVQFTAAFCYHPPEVASRIRRYVERIRRRQPGKELLDRLMQLRLAYDRSDDAPAHRIYRFDID
jgi:hypothetical protein